MAYTMSATGNKADVIGTIRQQASTQSAALSSQAERDHLNASLDDVEKIVQDHAGDGDSVGVSVSGHISQSDTALSISKQVGVSITRGALTEKAERRARQPGAEAATGTGVAAATPANASGQDVGAAAVADRGRI